MIITSSSRGAIVGVRRVDLRRKIQAVDLLVDAVVQLPGIA